MESLGYLKPIPLVIIKAVPPEHLLKREEKKEPEEYLSEDSEDEVSDPMPRHFEEDLAPLMVSRSGSSASLESAGLLFDQRPASACTDNSDTSIGPDFLIPPSEIEDSQFDSVNLFCTICNKTLKNLRTFKNHRARHLGILNHKCPECSKCFEGRSAVNRHLISNHNRELLPHEITTNPAAVAGANVCKPSSGVKIFKPSEMARKTFRPSETIVKGSDKEMPDLNPVNADGAKVNDALFDMVREGKSNVQKPSVIGQMPILLENPTPQPIKYIVGSQIRNDDNSGSDNEPFPMAEMDRSTVSPEPETLSDREDEEEKKEEEDKDKPVDPQVQEDKEMVPVDEPKSLHPDSILVTTNGSSLLLIPTHRLYDVLPLSKPSRSRLQHSLQYPRDALCH